MTAWDGSLDEPATTTPTLEEPETEEVDVEDDDAPDAEDAGTDDGDDGASDGEDPEELAPAAALIDGKFKTQDDLLAAYHEAQRALHESRQPQPEVEEEDDENTDPYGLWGTELGDGEAQQLAQRLIDRPGEAEGIVSYVQQNQHLFGPAGADIADQMFALWNAQNPRAAQQFIVDQRWAEHQEQLQAQQAPIQSHYTHQMASMAVHRATAELPRFADFKDQIMETIQSPNMQAFLAANPEYASDPQKMFEVLQGAWTNLIANEYRTNQQLAASGEPAPETTAKKPRTQQRSTVAAPDTDEVIGLFAPGTFRPEAG